MPTQRGNGRFYIKRKLPGVGAVYRSLETVRKGLATRRESMLVALAEQGRSDVVRAWLDGEVDLGGLLEAYEAGKVHELTAELRREDCALGDACRAALKNKGPDVKASTLERYETGLDHLRAFHGEDASVRDVLTEDAVQAFKAHRLDADAKPQTVNNDLGALSILATYALKRGWITERPKIKRFDYKARIRWLDPGQLATYMAALRPAFRTQMQLLVGTGMRLGETEALRVCDMRLGNGDSRAMIEDAKTTTGIRTVFVPGWAAEALQDHVEEHGLRGTDRLFTVDRRTVQAEHQRACGIAGIHGYTIHDHRHTAAVHLARAGIPLNLLQGQLGHKHIEMTMKYSRFHPDYNDVAVYFDRVGERLGLAPGNSSGNIPSPEVTIGAD